ncbi:MAG: hypothetical protein NXY57DRAFT_1075577 [Lentinula lateritia]|nr:MAG: hypothetical protein NXY57DRAFT_1075577 [Lentinula lateritia]
MSQFLLPSRIEGPIWLSPVEKAVLHKQVAMINQEIASLDSQKDIQLALLASVKNILSPVRRVPNEVLAHIFDDVLYHPENSKKYYAQRNIGKTLSTLSRVCVVWRHVAHTTPKLWSTLCLSIPKHMCALVGDLEWVEEWLMRSKGLPLDVYLILPQNIKHWPGCESWFNKTCDSLVDRLHKFLEKIINEPAHHRDCVSSLILIGHSTFFSPLLKLPASSLPGLKRVFLQVTKDFSASLTQVKAFLGAPKLREVEIIEPYEESQLKTILLPAEQLINLKLMPGPGISFLQCFIVPLLEDLDLDYGDIEFQDFCEIITKFQRQSGYIPNLRSLTVKLGSMDNTVLIPVLDFFPGINSLQLVGINFDVNFLFEAMTYNPSTEQNSLPVPNISTLKLVFKMNNWDNSYPSKLLSMILSRTLPDRPSKLQVDTGAATRGKKTRHEVGVGVHRLQRVSVCGSELEKAAEDVAHIAEIPSTTIYSECWDCIG